MTRTGKYEAAGQMCKRLRGDRVEESRLYVEALNSGALDRRAREGRDV